jgi:hypothetical protein
MTDTSSPDPDSSPGVIIFRKFARKAIEKSHAALKNCWMILFAGGTFALLHSFDELIDCRYYRAELPREFAATQYCAAVHASLSSFALSAVLFLVYVLTFYRFYVGNVRVFDIAYDEVFDFIDNLHNPKMKRAAATKGEEDDDFSNLFKYSDGLNKWESFCLILTALIIVYLTVTPLNPLKFLSVYLGLLVADVLWVLVSRASSGRGDVKKAREHIRAKIFGEFPKLSETYFERLFPSHAMDIWFGNNIIFSFLIGFTLAVYVWYAWYDCGLWTSAICGLDIASGWSAEQKGQVELWILWIAAGAALLNCLIDLLCARDFYHPRFSEAYGIVSGRNQPAQQDIQCAFCRLLPVVARWFTRS